MEALIYRIPGEPIVLLNPKLSSKTRYYDQKKATKLHLSILLAQQHNDRPLYQGPLHLDITFYFPMPKSISTRKANLLEGTPYPEHPSLSKAFHLIEEVASGILFQQEAQICSISSKKLYSHDPKTCFSIHEVK